jgi:hypothetical protein
MDFIIGILIFTKINQYIILGILVLKILLTYLLVH